MSIENRQELIETIDEIFPRLEELRADSTNIKAISDVLLALEKITPDIMKSLPIFVSEIPVSFSKLFEKFLMEPVDNPETGLKLTEEGMSIVRRAALGENPQDLLDEAETLLLKLSGEYKITSPAVADMVVTKESASKVETQEAEDSLILNAADEVLELLGLASSKPAPKLRDKQLDAEEIFKIAKTSGGAEAGAEAAGAGEKPKVEEPPKRWTPESGEPSPISQTGRFYDILNLLEKGVQPAQREEPEVKTEAEQEAEEKKKEEAIEQIRSILEGKMEFPQHDQIQPATESTLQQAREDAAKPRKIAQPSPERQREVEDFIEQTLKKSAGGAELLEPDGRRQMEAEAALEHTRETSREPHKQADWTPEMERQKEAEEAIRSARQGAAMPEKEPVAAGSQDEVETIFGQAKAASPTSDEDEESSREQREAEEIMAQFARPKAGKEEPPAEMAASMEPEPEKEKAAAEKAELSAKQREAEEIMAQFAKQATPEEPAMAEAAPEEEEPLFEQEPAMAEVAAEEEDLVVEEEPVMAEAAAEEEEPVVEEEPAMAQAAAEEAEPLVEEEPAIAEAAAEEEAPAEPLAAMAGYDDGGIMGEEGEDDIFAQLAGEEPVAAPELEEEPPSDPLSEKLSGIANEVTLMDSDMSDKKAVSDVMLSFEEIQAELAGRSSANEITAVADALASLYEKILMEGVEDCKTAVDLTISGIMVLSAFLENPDLETLKDQGLEILKKLEMTFGATPQKTPLTKEAKPEPEPVTGLEGVVEGPKFAGYESVQLATSEDLLIYTEFVSEVSDAGAHIEQDLLELETNPDNMELVNDLFRAFHSIKGAAGFLGVNTVNIICHEAESLLDRLRKRLMVSNQDCVDLLLRGLDVMRLVNEGLSEGCDKAKMNMPGAFLEIPRYNVDQLSRSFGGIGLAAQEPPPAAHAVVTAVEKSEETQEEEEEKADDKGALLGQILVDEGKVTEEDLELALIAQKEKRPLGEILVEMGMVDQPSVEQALVDQVDRKKKIKAASLKIDTEKLDSLLEMVGELVITQSIVNQEVESLKGERSRLAKNIQSLGKITKSIQDQVMTLRMVPLKQTFQKMSRLVRDLSKKMKKPVSLHLSGEDTEIDKTIIEELNDPLVHLLRNAMDHGIEPAEERVKNAKPATGNIWLNAYHRGGNVYIEVIDDGRGLDRDRIRRKAVEKGLVDEGAELSDQETYALVLMPGFSTHDQATEISGRGVGMDVVRSNIDGLGGRLDISSKPMEGSEFTIRLPLTMAIVDGMIVQIGDDRFVIPTIAIRESIRPRREEVSTYKNKGEMIDVRGKLLPLVRLTKFLGIQNGERVKPWDGLVIIVESDEKEFGFLVDDLLGQQQVVIKSLDKRFKGLPGISGGTILGDGRVGLILDVASVVEYN